MDTRANIIENIWEQARVDLRALGDALVKLAPMTDPDAIERAEGDNKELMLAVRLLAKLALEAQRLHQGEASSFAYESAEPTPEQWIAFFNAQSPERRMLIARMAIQNGSIARICFQSDHEGKIHELKLAKEKLAEASKRPDRTIENIMLETVKDYAYRLVSSGSPEKKQVGQELLKTIGVK
jgi:hypothetical protein